jgi:NAD(P)-dependent dehydrogenase (short-subunit alcohol dehydrogenase family)
LDLGLAGKVALITGVSQGIGLACADVLTAEGMNVFGTSRSTPADRPHLGHLAIDMADPDAGARAVEACVERFGGLDVLVNNVGNGRISAGFVAEDDETWREFWELNFMSTVRTTRSALPHLLEANGGTIINISSVNAAMPEPGIYSYSAYKAAMNNVTVNLGREYAGRGVRVVGIAPGPVSTPLWLGPTGVAAQASAMGAGEPDEIVAAAQKEIPLGRFATAEEIGWAVAFLASARAGSITATTLRLDGGITPTV